MITNTIEILGVSVHSCTVQQLHQEIETLVSSDAHELVLNVNVHCLNLAQEQIWLKDFLNSAAINFCDGVGVILGARLLGETIPERITYADWMWQLAEFSAVRGYSFFLLGAKPGVAEAAAAQLSERYPTLEIAGVHHGYFDKTYDSAENLAVIEAINSTKPNILVLGFGMPLQEKWLMENWSRVDANIALTGGAVFDYLSGELRRAPAWMTSHGFEWLGRLFIEPRRLYKRYLLGNPLFITRVLWQRLGSRTNLP
jgi:N-acetylglucosaminyldiphosphoundecaprenol N-acetyl-beta-D-mannosaminyltransferase